MRLAADAAVHQFLAILSDAFGRWLDMRAEQTAHVDRWADRYHKRLRSDAVAVGPEEHARASPCAGQYLLRQA